MSSRARFAERRRRFAEEYILDFNAAQAAIRAGYKPRAARQQASILLTRPDVQQHIQELRAEAAQRSTVTLDRVIEEISRIALFDMRELLDANGNVKPPDQWSDNAAAAVGQLEVIERQDDAQKGTSARVSRVRLWDKVNALVHLGRHLGGLREPRDEAPGLRIDAFDPALLSDVELAQFVALARKAVEPKRVAGKRLTP